MIRWADRLDVGDRCCVVVATDRPEDWLPAIEAWRRGSVEWVLCSEPWGVGAGMASCAKAAHENGDLLAVLIDRSGMRAILEAEMERTDLPVCPVAFVQPGRLDDEGLDADEYRRQYARQQEAGWTRGVHTHWDPDPVGLILWAQGWWDRHLRPPDDNAKSPGEGWEDKP